MLHIKWYFWISVGSVVQYHGEIWVYICGNNMEINWSSELYPSQLAAIAEDHLEWQPHMWCPACSVQHLSSLICYKIHLPVFSSAGGKMNQYVVFIGLYWSLFISLAIVRCWVKVMWEHTLTWFFRWISFLVIVWLNLYFHQVSYPQLILWSLKLLIPLMPMLVEVTVE